MKLLEVLISMFKVVAMNNKRNKVGKQNLRIDLYKVAKNSKVVRK